MDDCLETGFIVRTAGRLSRISNGFPTSGMTIVKIGIIIFIVG